VLRAVDCSIVELLVPLQKFMPSANRSRMRTPWTSSPVVGVLPSTPIHPPVVKCSIQRLVSLDALPKVPLTPGTLFESSRSTTSPERARSERTQSPAHAKRAAAPVSVDRHMPAPCTVTFFTFSTVAASR
jgi:hypothetical protein